MIDSVFRRTVSFSTAAVTNYHKLSDLKQHRRLAFHSGGQASNPEAGQDCALCRLQGEPASGDRRHSWARGPFLGPLHPLLLRHGPFRGRLPRRSLLMLLWWHGARHQASQETRAPHWSRARGLSPGKDTRAQAREGGPGRVCESLFCPSQGLPHLWSTKV